MTGPLYLRATTRISGTLHVLSTASLGGYTYNFVGQSTLGTLS